MPNFEASALVRGVKICRARKISKKTVGRYHTDLWGLWYRAGQLVHGVVADVADPVIACYIFFRSSSRMSEGNWSSCIAATLHAEFVDDALGKVLLVDNQSPALPVASNPHPSLI